jgi:acetyl esterase/lipase
MKTITIAKPTVRTRWQGIPAGVKIIRDIEFKVVGDRRLLLDIYMPEAPKQPVPVVIWICGGGWRGMSRFGPPVVSAWLAGHGFAVIGADYRVSGEATFPAAVEDCCDVVRWVRKQGKKHQLDPQHIGTWGDSAGGHLAALTGLKMKTQAVCAFCPPTELALMADRDFVAPFIGGMPEQKPREYKLASPVTLVRRGAPPHLLVHGTADDCVPFDQSVWYAARLEAVGTAVTFVRFPGLGHNCEVLYGAEEIKPVVTKFFQRWLA